MKKLLTIFLSVMLIAALAVTANATEETPTRKEAIIQEARRVYLYSRSTAGRSSFAGWCGLMTSHQLYHMGINETIIVNDGNRQYDYYEKMEVTSGGYYISAYPATDYTLKEALQAVTKNGTKDAYNILVGFQWTNTGPQAGGRYGHAVVINAILDGTVYFVESFYTSIAGAEGNVGQCSIDRFAQLFDGWTSFEGLIDFGTGQYAEACETYETSMYVRTRFETTLRSQPCLLGEKDSFIMRQISAGELLLVTAICKDYDTGMAYYRVEDGEGVGYISAGAVSVYQISGENCLALSDENIPAYQKPGKALKLSGNVLAQRGDVGKIEVAITDLAGKVIARETVKTDGFKQSLSILNKKLSAHKLVAGMYRVQIYGSVACKYVVGIDVKTVYTTQLLCEKILQVNKTPTNARICYYPEEQTAPLNGWVLDEESWYYYVDGEPQTGWHEDHANRYYLKENGAVTTGWKKIDGVKCYFTATGALYSGWLYTQDGMTYLPETGGQAAGWQTIDKSKYYFDENKLLVTEGIVNDGKKQYEIQPDGQAKLIKK